MAEEIALFHHERWDGMGYPCGLQGDEIPLTARIVAVADTFDALIHARPYKEAWEVTDAIAEIERDRGYQFDPDVVDVLLRLYSEGRLGLSDEQVPDRPAALTTAPAAAPCPSGLSSGAIRADNYRSLRWTPVAEGERRV